ncbi:PadR family transcriptional regulator [Streptomyces boncukensis]|uniref:PadR family transcriptional regulator n=1 Tax=Streptomyces boncukensis TaxID=2711219 RepID=A0A6G4WZ05_9ACTN|nr:PadR family transcriptional regulator [Streptomyces boncukensis]NGO70092.1 PadR family transcriptional regulator [Streptomyces boncukensis]
MAPVFAHGRLRLYLLMLLDEAPRHGYEVIRLLEERFQGLYAPSAGTVYPRLAKLEAEGLVSHTTEGGRKVYAITKAGRAELAGRQTELAELEVEIRESLAALAADIRADVSGSADELRREVREQTRDEVLRAKEDWKEQARRAKQEARQARRQARKEREAHTEAVEEVQRIARQVQDQIQTHVHTGDWQGAVREGMSQLAREMGNLGRIAGSAAGWPPYESPAPPEQRPGPSPGSTEDAAGTETGTGTAAGAGTAYEAEEPTGDTVRDLERLLDRFRDDVRDAARDSGVTEDQFREVRRRLSTASAHIVATLRSG